MMPSSTEWAGVDRRRRSEDMDLQALMQQTVRTTVAEMHHACLTPEEQQYVRMAIEREARKAKVAQAIIEKSLAGLVWAALVAIGTALWHHFGGGR